MFLFSCLCSDFSLVYFTFNVTVTIHGARVWFPADTGFIDLLITALLRLDIMDLMLFVQL